MKKIEIMASFNSTDGRRNAVVVNVNGVFVVDLYEDGVLCESVRFPDKSLCWAEDVAENHCLYIR